MTLEEMKRQRKEQGFTYEQLSEKSGIPIGTIQKIFGGITKSPRYETLQALEHVLQPSGGADLVQEERAVYELKKQGEYTLEDYYKIPDERRVELIDGVIYDMESPSMMHQLIIGQICTKLLTCITEHGLDWIPFIAPADVQLDCDNRTMLQPDVFIVCDRSRIMETHIYGAPDFAVEVLSKSTRRKDMNLKLRKYENAGVREYWIIDPEKKKIIAYIFGDEPDVNIYGFDAKVPVFISNGLCEVDFAEIYEYIKFLY